MKKHLYEVKRLDIPAYLKWWFIKYRNTGTLSEILENLASPITLTDSLKRKFKIFKIGGNSVQDGEPSPTNEVPIQNVTGNVEVKVENKNLFDEEWTGTVSTNFIPVTAGESYIYSEQGAGSAMNWRFYTNTSDTNYIQVNTSARVPYVPENNGYVKLYKTTTTKIECQVEKGTTVTSYVPHEQQTVTFPLEEGQVLHEGDTIEDKIVQKRKTVVLDGTEEWVLTNAEVGQFRLAINDMTKNPILCNYFGYKLTYSANGKPYLRPAGGAIFAEIGTEMLDEITVNAWKAWVAEKYANGTPLTLEYELETPIEIPFTQAQATAKAQIDSLHSYKDTTYISSTNDPSPLFTIQYVKEET